MASLYIPLRRVGDSVPSQVMTITNIHTTWISQSFSCENAVNVLVAIINLWSDTWRDTLGLAVGTASYNFHPFSSKAEKHSSVFRETVVHREQFGMETGPSEFISQPISTSAGG
jgi:hypothetical protein